MRSIKVVSLLLVLLLLFGCAKKGAKHLSPAERMRYAREHNLDRLPPSDIPLVINDRVIAWMEYFQGVGHKHFKRYLERSGKFTQVMQDILKKNGMPQDLIYIALIESGFNTNAYSRAHAVGPWQFIRGTGRRYDLKINSWEDERRHPIKSTYAAIAYLKDLYAEFDDWYLAMAAYNAGEGRIRRAIEESGSRDFWVIADAEEKYIRAETRDYVPKFIAAAIMAKVPQNFGFADIKYQDPLEYEDSTVETQTDIEVIAKCAGVGTSEIADLNPHLVRGATPPGVRNYVVHLPKDKAKKFKVAYAKVPENERIQIVYHKVRRGETLTRVARKYGVSRSALASANNIRTRSRLRTGQMLVIPKGAAAAYAYADDSGGSKKARSKKIVYHRVKRGETLSHIAGKYDVTVSQLKRWNHIRRSTSLRAGRKLKIYRTVYVARSSTPPKSRDSSYDSTTSEHRVISGDTLWSISQNYGVPLKELMAMNGLNAKSKIKPGQKLTIRTYKKKEEVIELNDEEEAIGETVEKKEIKIAMADNNTKTINHEIEEGESLWTISRKYGVSIEELMELNDLDSARKIRAGKKLIIRQPKKSASTEKEAIAVVAARQSGPDDIKIDNTKKVAWEEKTTTTSHKLKQGEVLGTVAEKHGVSVKDLMKWNNIKNPRRVRAGQVLKIKGGTARASPQKSTKTTEPAVNTKAEEAPKPVKEDGVPLKISDDTKPVVTAKTYKVKSGDTLWDIARRHGVTISDIQSWNNLKDPSSVKPGESIIIRQ